MNILNWFTYFTIFVLLAGVLVYGVILFKAFVLQDENLKADLNKSPAHSFGLPFSAIASFGLVSLLDLGTAGSSLKFGILGFEFQGPSAQITLWALCYAVFVWSMVKARE